MTLQGKKMKDGEDGGIKYGCMDVDANDEDEDMPKRDNPRAKSGSVV